MMAELTLKSTFKLHTGRTMPILGFGVWDSPRTVTAKSIATAIEVGYRHIDSAQYYNNEDLVGQAATTNPKVPRTDLFLTTKIIDPPGGPSASVKSILPNLQESVRKMHPVDESKGEKPYVDLFLIHSPSSGPEGRKALWAALAELQKIGEAKDIGVSNFGVKHLETLPAPKPAINQIELHPWCQQKDIVEYCKANDIVVQAYAPLVRNQKADDPTLNKIAKETGKTAAQVLLRWSLQKGFSPLPKSDTPSRIAQNADLYGFELSKPQMDELDALDEDMHICPNATKCA